MKTRLTLSDVSGITPEELRSYSKNDLLRVLAPIRDAANKRIGRLEKTGMRNIPALNAIQDTGGRIYGSKWNTNRDLIKEIQRGKAFLGYKTSTATGARAYEKWATGRQGAIPNFRLGDGPSIRYGEMTPSQVGKYWDILHKMQEKGIQIAGEFYDAFKTILRNSVSSDDPVGAFINSMPAAAQDYIRERVSLIEGDDEDSTIVDKILEGIDAYNDWVTDYADEAEEGPEGAYIPLTV